MTKTKLEMRKLAGDDLWTLLDIINLLDVTDEFVAIFDKGSQQAMAAKVTKLKTKKAQEAELQSIGTKVMAGLVKKALSNMKAIREPLNALLADITGSDIKDIKGLGIAEYVGLVTDFFKKPELRDLASSIAGLLSGKTNAID